VPAAAIDFSAAIAEKLLVRSVAEIDADAVLELLLALALALALVLAEADVAGVLLLLLLLLLLQAARSSAAAAAVTASPARAVTEYNGVPRLLSRDMPTGHVRDQIRGEPGLCLDRAPLRNRRTAGRNVPVNTFVKPLKKG
jgi:hypothetical protein